MIPLAVAYKARRAGQRTHKGLSEHDVMLIIVITIIIAIVVITDFIVTITIYQIYIIYAPPGNKLPQSLVLIS